MTGRQVSFWRRRAAGARWLRLALGAVVLIAVSSLSIAVGVAARQPDISLRAGLAAASADDNSMVWKRFAASDASVQDAATRAQLRRAFGEAPIRIASSTVGAAVSVVHGDQVILPLRDDASLRAAAPGMPTLERGQVAIDATGAANLHVAVGDTIPVETPVGTRTLTVAAVWHAADPRSPIWNGIGLGTTGAVARVALAPAELTADQIALTSRWSISPDPARLQVADLPAIERGFARLAAAPLKSATYEELSGGGAATVASLREGLAASAAVVPVAVALLAAGAALAMLLLTRLLTEVRVDETALLRARGASRMQMAGGDLRGALAPVVGAAVGAGIVTQVLLFLVVAPPTGWAEVALPAILPAITVLVAVIAASSATTRDRTRGRAVGVALAVGAALLVVLAGIGVFRIQSAGVGADPAADLAPAFVIAALVIVGVLSGPSVAAAADRVARRRNGISAPLATGRLRWQPGLVVGALVLVALAIGSSGFASSAIPSSADFLRNAGRLVTGGDLDVQLAGNESIERGPTKNDVATLSGVTGAAAAAPALFEQVELGDVSTTLAAAPVSRMAALQSGGLADVPALAATIGDPVGIPLTGAGSLRVNLSVGADSAPTDTRVWLTAWIIRPGSGAVRVDLPSAPLGTGTVEARLPAGGRGRIAAIDATLQSSGTVDDLVVTVRSLAQGSAGAFHPLPLPPADWVLTNAVPTDPGTASSGRLGWSAPLEADVKDGRVGLGRLMPRGTAVVPVALSRSLATTGGISMGGRATLTADPNIPFIVAAIVPHTIGAGGGDGAWADLPTLQTALLRLGPDVPRADHVWLAVSNAAQAARRIGAREPTAVVTDSPVVAFSPLAQPVTAGTLAAAIGTLLFALLGMATVVTSLMRARHAEIAVLRALGASARAQRIASRIEFLAVLGYAVVIGAIAAIVAVELTVPSIVHGVASGVAPDVAAPVVLDPVILGSAALVLVVGALTGLIVQERMITSVATRPGAEVER